MAPASRSLENGMPFEAMNLAVPPNRVALRSPVKMKMKAIAERPRMVARASIRASLRIVTHRGRTRFPARDRSHRGVGAHALLAGAAFHAAQWPASEMT